MAICGIYSINCKTDNKIIVGSSLHIRRRYSQHLYKLRRNKHSNPYLQNAWNKYGENDFSLSIIEECEELDLLKKEDEWMEVKNSLDRNFGYNFKAAERPVHNKKTCRKISEQKKGCKNPMYGKHHSEEHKKKISEALKGKGARYKASKETKQKMSKSQMGKKLSEETKIKIGLASKGRVKSAEERQKLSDAQSGEKHWNYGKHISKETKVKMSIAQKGKHAMSAEAKALLSERMKKNNPMYKKEYVLKRAKTIKIKKTD